MLFCGVQPAISLVAHWCNTETCPIFQAEMERALLQGERQAELDQIDAETDIIAQLQHKLDELENAIQREKDKVERAEDKRYLYLNPPITIQVYGIQMFAEVIHIL